VRIRGRAFIGLGLLLAVAIAASDAETGQQRAAPRQSSVAQETTITVTPELTDEILANPGMGWQTFHRTARQDKNLPDWIPSTIHYACWAIADGWRGGVLSFVNRRAKSLERGAPFFSPRSWPGPSAASGCAQSGRRPVPAVGPCRCGTPDNDLPVAGWEFRVRARRCNRGIGPNGGGNGCPPPPDWN
jgi:hypothetical protein